MNEKQLRLLKANKIQQKPTQANLLTIASLLFILFYMNPQGRMHTRSWLTVTISHPLGYNYGDHDLTQGTIGLTYKYPLVRA